MQNHLPQIPAGARSIESFTVNHLNGDKDLVTLYQNLDGATTVLIDSFRGGFWDSVLLRPETTDALRRALDKAHRQRRSAP